ncbi:Hypothetical predicted protein, partial [Paramuricea clavata]
MSNDPKQLLRACAENLLNAMTRLENTSNSSQQVPLNSPITSPTAASPQVHRPQQVPVHSPMLSPTTASQVLRPTAAEEHRNLFGYRPPSSSNRNNRQPPSKRKRITTSTGQQVSIPVRNTWSRTFACLAKRNATTAPSAAEKVNMALSGLDERTICFHKGGNCEHVHNKILEAFPMLSDVGGYNILRTGERGNCNLMLLAMPPGGYTVSFLKSTIGSAKGYIRPYQKDIVIGNSIFTSKGQTQISTSPRVECVNCHVAVAMDMMQEHDEVCGGGGSGNVANDSA